MLNMKQPPGAGSIVQCADWNKKQAWLVSICTISRCLLHERKGKYGQWPDFIFSALPRFHVWKQLKIIYFPGASNSFLASSPSYGLQKCITGNLLQNWNRNWVSPNFKAHNCLKCHSMLWYHVFIFFKPDELDMNHDEQPQTKSKWTGVLLLIAFHVWR